MAPDDRPWGTPPRGARRLRPEPAAREGARGDGGTEALRRRPGRRAPSARRTALPPAARARADVPARPPDRRARGRSRTARASPEHVLVGGKGLLAAALPGEVGRHARPRPLPCLAQPVGVG